MGFMRRLLPLAFVALLAMPASAEYTKYSEFRAENPIVNETVALLSSSDLHGTLNRISALNLRSAIRDLEDGSQPSELPANYVRGMQSAMEDLDADLAAADADFAALSCTESPGDPDCLTDADINLRRWILVQAVNNTLLNRLTELNRAGEMLGCTCFDCVAGDAEWTCAPSEGFSSDLNLALQDLISLPGGVDANTLGQWLSDIVDRAEPDSPMDPGASWCFETPLSCNTGTNANNIAARVEELRSAHGEPIIDNAYVHGEPIID